VQKLHDATSALLSIGSSVWGGFRTNQTDSQQDSIVKLNERIQELKEEREQMAVELSAFRFILRGERNEKLNLVESNLSLSSKSNKQKLLINKMWNHIRNGTKPSDAELKSMEGEVKDLLGTLALSASSLTGSTPPPSNDKRNNLFKSKNLTPRKSNGDEAPPDFYHASKHMSPYYYYAEKHVEGRHPNILIDTHTYSFPLLRLTNTCRRR